MEYNLEISDVVDIFLTEVFEKERHEPVSAYERGRFDMLRMVANLTGVEPNTIERLEHLEVGEYAARVI